MYSVTVLRVKGWNGSDAVSFRYTTRGYSKWNKLTQSLEGKKNQSQEKC